MSPDLSPGAKAVIERLTALNDERADEIARLTRELAEAKARAVIPDGWVAVPSVSDIASEIRALGYTTNSQSIEVAEKVFAILSARPEFPPNGLPMESDHE